MKRKMAILFIVLANFIILAHAVVPHHHHHEDIYFHHNAGGCCNSSVLFSFTHNDDDCSHNDSERETCKLQDLLSKLVLNTKERENFIAAVESDFQDYYIANLFLSDTDVLQEVTYTKYRQYNEHVPKSCVETCLSLRAPPCC